MATAPVQAEPQGQGDSQATAPQAMSAEQRQQVQAFRQTRQEMIELQQKLNKIQQETVEAHPELKEQQDAFGELLLAEMKSKGHTPEQDLARLKEMRDELRSEGTPKEERQQLMVEFQQKAQAYKKAQQEALQSEKVKKARGELVQAITTAMRERNPETDKLLEELRQKQQKLMEIRKSATEGQ